jgi:hypothetical protein
MSKTTLKQIANIKEFHNLLSINHKISFILHLFLISYISIYNYQGERTHFQGKWTWNHQVVDDRPEIWFNQKF